MERKRIVVEQLEFKSRTTRRKKIIEVLEEFYDDINEDMIIEIISFMDSDKESLKVKVLVITKTEEDYIFERKKKGLFLWWILLGILLIGLLGYIITRDSVDDHTPSTPDEREIIEIDDYEYHDYLEEHHEEEAGFVLGSPVISLPNERGTVRIPQREQEVNNPVIIIPEIVREYRLVFSGNGVGTDIANMIRVNQDHIIIDNPFVRDGFEFLGWSTNPLSHTVEFMPGEVVSNLAGENKTFTLYAIWRREVTATFEGVELSCVYFNNEDGCEVITPLINRDGWNSAGWSRVENGTLLSALENAPVRITEDTTFYPITYREVRTIFNANGSTLSSTEEVCRVWNIGTTCNITIPTVTRDGWNILGFNTSATSTTGSIYAVPNTVVSVSVDSTWYAVTSITHTATFNENGADSIGASTLSCTRFNLEENCSISSPSITRVGYIVVGWNTDSSATTSTWNLNTSRAINSDETWYAITIEILVWEFSYTGGEQTLQVAPGIYTIELWGAQGGNSAVNGGLGGYAFGTIAIDEISTFNIFVGGQGSGRSSIIGGINAGGFNGGGNSGIIRNNTGGDITLINGAGGGGATDVRLNGSLLNDRIIVAGGGGGGANHGAPGIGGGLTGTRGQVSDGSGNFVNDSTTHTGAGGATQTAGGIAGRRGATVVAFAGTLGQGGDGATSAGLTHASGAGGGGGFFGGGGGGASGGITNSAPGGGGSGFIGGMDSGTLLSGGSMIPSPTSDSTIPGRVGNGFARIRRIG